MPINNLFFSKSSFRTQDIKMFVPKSHICLSPHAGKWFDKKAWVNFKIYVVTHWETNYYNTHIPQYSNN